MAKETREWPPEDERDLAMGRFMNAWSRVEHSLHFLFGGLSGVSGKTGEAIAHRVPDVGRMADLLIALGALNLPEEDKKELKQIREYLLIQARYRNSIVHAMWAMRPNAEKRVVNGLIHQWEWVRIYYVIDRRPRRSRRRQAGSRQVRVQCAPHTTPNREGLGIGGSDHKVRRDAL